MRVCSRRVVAAAVAAVAWVLPVRGAESPAGADPGAQVASEGEAIPGLTGDWLGLRRQLIEKGIVIDPRIIGEYSKVLRGGRDTEGCGAHYLFSLNLTVETEPLMNWKGGTFFTSFQVYDGQNSSDEVGDWQWVSNIDMDRERDQLSEIWYEQRLLDDKVRLKAGKIEVNSDFAWPDWAAEFIHGSAGSPVSAAPVLPSYPETAFGGSVFVEPCDCFYVGTGIFDGARAEGVQTGRTGPATLLGEPADLFLIGEAGLKWKLGSQKLSGRFGAGLWHHTGEFAEFDGRAQSGNNGVYFLIDHAIWRENAAEADDEQGIGMYVQFDLADPDVNEVDWHLGAGIAWIGVLPTRDQDAVGLGVQCAHFADDAGYDADCEVAWETFYKIQVTDYLGVKADLQYVTNPGGGAARDALVGLVRVELAF